MRHFIVTNIECGRWAQNVGGVKPEMRDSHPHPLDLIITLSSLYLEAKTISVLEN